MADFTIGLGNVAIGFKENQPELVLSHTVMRIHTVGLHTLMILKSGI